MINLLGSGGSSSDLNSLAAPDKATLGRRKSGNTDDVVRLLLEVSGDNRAAKFYNHGEQHLYVSLQPVTPGSGGPGADQARAGGHSSVSGQNREFVQVNYLSHQVETCRQQQSAGPHCASCLHLQRQCCQRPGVRRLLRPLRRAVTQIRK